MTKLSAAFCNFVNTPRTMKHKVKHKHISLMLQSTFFITLIFMKHAIAQRQCVKILYTKIHPNLLRNMGSIASNPMTQSMPVTKLTFVELLFSQQRFINNSHSELYENSEKD